MSALDLDPSDARQNAREARLWAALRETKQASAREQIFSLYTRLAKRVARQHHLDRRSGAVDLDDLNQLAFAGLLEAIDRFDPSYGVSFARFAEPRIKGSVRDGLRKSSEVREQISFRNRMRAERAKSLSTDIDAGAGSAEDAFNRLVEAAVGLALGVMLEGTELLVSQEATSPMPDPYRQTVWNQAVQRVRSEVDALDGRERFVIVEHYMNGVDFLNIASALGLSKGRVSQLHRDALARVKRRLERLGDFRLAR